MSNTTQILQQLANINSFISNIINKAKNLKDFDSATDLNPTDFVHVSQGGEDKKAALSLITSKLVPAFAQSYTYTAPNNTFVTDRPITAILDIQIEHGCNFDSYATVANGNEVTIDDSIIFGGETIKIIYK